MPASGATTLPLNRRSLAKGLNNHAQLLEAIRDEVLKQQAQIGALLDGKAQTDQQIAGLAVLRRDLDAFVAQQAELIQDLATQLAIAQADVKDLKSIGTRHLVGRLYWLFTGQ